MKKGLKIAMVYIGLVIGAGFASGREIMEYFNFPGGTDHSGIVLATFLLIAVCYLILRRASLSGITTFDGYLKAVAGRGAGAVRLFMLLYLFCGFFTMLAGSGALLRQSLMLPSPAGCLFMAAVCFLILAFDLKGIVALNTVLVPCMIAGIFYICICSVLFGTQSAFSFASLGRGMLTSAICYVSYNTISAASVLIPLSKGITAKEIRAAAVTGGLVLGILITAVWAVQSQYFDALWDSEIPMLQLAAMAGRSEKYLYSLILMMAICTTAVSQGFGILSAFAPADTKQRISRAAVLCLAALPFSMLGFAGLVAHLYAFFGITGLFWMGLVLVDFYRR